MISMCFDVVAMAYLNSQRRMKEECWLCATYIICICGSTDLTGCCMRSLFPSQDYWISFDPVVSIAIASVGMESGNYHTSPIWKLRRWTTLSLGVRVGMGVPVRRVRVGEAVQWTTTTTHVQSFDQ